MDLAPWRTRAFGSPMTTRRQYPRRHGVECDAYGRGRAEYDLVSSVPLELVFVPSAHASTRLRLKALRIVRVVKWYGMLTSSVSRSKNLMREHISRGSVSASVQLRVCSSASSSVSRPSPSRTSSRALRARGATSAAVHGRGGRRHRRRSPPRRGISAAHRGVGMSWAMASLDDGRLAATSPRRRPPSDSSPSVAMIAADGLLLVRHRQRERDRQPDRHGAAELSRAKWIACFPMDDLTIGCASASAPKIIRRTSVTSATRPRSPTTASSTSSTPA